MDGWKKIGVWISCFLHRSVLHWQGALNGWLEKKMWQTGWFLTWSSGNINMSTVLPFNSPSGHWQNNLDSSFRFREIAGRRGRVNLFIWGRCSVYFVLLFFKALMWIIHFGKWMGAVACTWYFLSHALLLVRNTFPFGVNAKDKNKAVQITTPLINSAKAIVLAFKRTGKCVSSATNVMHSTLFSHEEENRVF